jgi:predicted ATPase
LNVRRAGDERYVLAGGPGSGKTTLLMALRELGYRTVGDSARALIAARLREGKSPRPEPETFARQILEMEILDYEKSRSDSGPVFHERSVVDALGGLRGLGAMTKTEAQSYLDRFPYHERVLLFPPWPEIYVTDTERDQTYDESVRVYERSQSFYEDCGYRTVEVPRLDVDGRVEFVRSFLQSDDGGRSMS